MKKIWNTIKAFKHVIVLGFFIIVLGTILFLDKPTYTYTTTVEKKYEEVFDLNKVPSGLIIWRHGVPDTEMAFNHADSASRYEYFDVGILSMSKKVYKVRVPFYVMGLFPLGGTVNIENMPKNHIPKYRNNTIPKNNNKNI